MHCLGHAVAVRDLSTHLEEEAERGENLETNRQAEKREDGKYGRGGAKGNNAKRKRWENGKDAKRKRRQEEMTRRGRDAKMEKTRRGKKRREEGKYAKRRKTQKV